MAPAMAPAISMARIQGLLTESSHQTTQPSSTAAPPNSRFSPSSMRRLNCFDWTRPTTLSEAGRPSPSATLPIYPDVCRARPTDNGSIADKRQEQQPSLCCERQSQRIKGGHRKPSLFRLPAAGILSSSTVLSPHNVRPRRRGRDVKSKCSTTRSTANNTIGVPSHQQQKQHQETSTNCETETLKRPDEGWTTPCEALTGVSLMFPSCDIIVCDSVKVVEARVVRSTRIAEYGVSTEDFWREIYKREIDLVVKPKYTTFLSCSTEADVFISQQHEAGSDLQSAAATDIMPIDLLVADELKFPFPDISTELRATIIDWMRQVVTNLSWKWSAFFVAAHAFDSYLTCPRFTKAMHASISASDCPAATLARELSSVPDGQDADPEITETMLPVLATAALFLGVSAEEEHSKAHGVKMFVTDLPNVRSIRQIFVQQLDMLTSLPSGLLITRTPEDFLYYFLGNMRISQDVRFRAIYERLLVSEITLGVFVQWVLTVAVLVYMNGGYSVLRSSHLTAACVIPILAATVAPKLSTSITMLIAFSHDVFKFSPPQQILRVLYYAVPMIRDYIHRTSAPPRIAPWVTMRDLHRIFNMFRTPPLHSTSPRHHSVSATSVMVIEENTTPIVKSACSTRSSITSLQRSTPSTSIGSSSGRVITESSRRNRRAEGN